MEFFSEQRNSCFQDAKRNYMRGALSLPVQIFFVCDWNWKAQSEKLSCVYSLHLCCCQHAFQLPRVATKVLFCFQQAHIPV